MKWKTLLEVAGDQPLIDSSTLLSAGDPPHEVRRQLSRWTRAGRLMQLRKGLYMLPSPWHGRTPHPFTIAARLHPGSCVSMQSALQFHGLMEDSGPEVTSVTVRRPERVVNSLGVFTYRHVRPSLFWGFVDVGMPDGEAPVHVACPEKAFLDLAYLTPGADRPSFVRDLRLHWHPINQLTLLAMACRSGRPKLLRTVLLVRDLLD